MRSVEQITLAISGVACHRDQLRRQRLHAACLVDADTNVEQVFADLDYLIAKETARIDTLLAELHEARQGATV